MSSGKDKKNFWNCFQYSLKQALKLSLRSTTNQWGFSTWTHFSLCTTYLRPCLYYITIISPPFPIKNHSQKIIFFFFFFKWDSWVECVRYQTLHMKRLSDKYKVYFKSLDLLPLQSSCTSVSFPTIGTRVSQLHRRFKLNRLHYIVY